jgi:hypothetical protein
MLPPDWLTPEHFAMGVCIYLLFRMEKTIKGLTEAVQNIAPKRDRRGRER